MNYIDDYSACERTYATLRIYPRNAKPNEVSRLLGLNPTRISIAGEKSPRHVNGWFLSSQGTIESRDARRHIDWLLDQIEPTQSAFLKLVNDDAEADIFCFWESSSGNGGPIILPHQMARLLKFNLSVGWDIWFSEHE